MEKGREEGKEKGRRNAGREKRKRKEEENGGRKERPHSPIPGLETIK